MVLSSVLGPHASATPFDDEMNGQTGRPPRHAPAHLDVQVFRHNPPVSRNPGHLQGAETARRLHSQLDAVCGTAYLTRVPQGVASGLSRTPLEKTGHEDSAPIGEGFPVEALGAFHAIHGVGGIVETGSAIRGLASTCRTLSRRQETRAAFTQSQLALNDAHRALMSSKASPAMARGFCEAAKRAWQARSSSVQLDTDMRHAPERIVDVVRYTVVSWTSRLFSALKLAFKASAWISLAASIVGIVGAAFQALAGVVKWHSAGKRVKQAKRALRWLEGCPSAGDQTPLQTHVIRHIVNRRKDELRKARDSRVKARMETITGFVATLFSALAFIFPPLGFIAIATGLAYAGYRVYRGIRSFFSTRELNRRETAMRVDFSTPEFIETLNRSAQSEGLTVDGTHGSSALHAAKMKVVKENPCYAIHCLIELIQQDGAAWLNVLLEQLGIPRPDRDAVFLLAHTNDKVEASRCLERMFFESDWSSFVQATKPRAAA